MIGRFILLGASASLMMASAGLAQDGTGPTDAQIAHIAYTAGQIDLSAGEQALAKTSNDEVRAFARTMVRDHEAVNEQALALVKKLGVAPEDNATSQALVRAAAEKSRELGGLAGTDFDRAYVANEVAFHRTVNEALAGTLIPEADNPDLKALLESGLALFQEHQKHAEHLAQDLR